MVDVGRIEQAGTEVAALWRATETDVEAGGEGASNDLPIAQLDESASDGILKLLRYADVAALRRDASGIGLPSDDAELFGWLADILLCDQPLPEAGPPSRGQTGLLVRLIQARLQLLGADGRPAGRPFDRGDEVALAALAGWLLRPSLVIDDQSSPTARWLRQLEASRADALRELLSVTATADGMITALIERDPSGFVVAPSPPDKPIIRGFDRLATGPDGTLITGSIEVWSRVTFGTLTRPLFETEFDHDPAAMAEDNANRLALRLIQMKLRQAGHYMAEIDGLFGPASWHGLKDACGFAEPSALLSSEAQPEKQDQIWAPIGDGRRVGVSLRLMQRRVLPRSEEPASSESLIAQLRAAPECCVVAVDGASQREKELASRPPSPGLFRGFRGMLRWVGRTLGELLTAVGKVVDAALRPVRDLLHWLRTMVRHVVAGLRRAYQPAARFLLGQPVGDAAMVTRFAFDRDCFVFVATPVDVPAVRAHLRALRLDQAILTWSVRIAVALVRALLTGVLGWAGLVVTLLRAAYELFVTIPESDDFALVS